MTRPHKAPQYNTACIECMKIHPSSNIAGLQREAEDRIAQNTRNIDHERSFMNLFIHGLDESGNPIVNHEKPDRSLEDRIYGRINEVGARVRRDRQETSVERGHNTKESVVCEGMILQVSHAWTMELLKQDDMLDENGQIRKDRQLPTDGKVYSMFMEMYKFVCDRFGADNVIGACIHLDEYTPHMHVFVVPITMKEKRYAGKSLTDEDGNPVVRGVLDAKNIFSPTTIKQLWPDIAEHLKDYGVSKAEGRVPKSAYEDVATMDAVVRQRQEVIHQKNEEISKQDICLEAKVLANKRLANEIEQKEEQIKGIDSDISQKREQRRDLDLKVSDLDAMLKQRQKQADALPSFGPPPQKGLLGYNTKEVDEFIKAAVAKDRVRVASAIKMDEEPTRKQMWGMIQEYRPKVEEYDKLIRDPEALERKAKEVREQQSRKRILEIALAALGPDFKPDHFESAPAYGGSDELVTGHFEYGGDYRALQICPSGKVFSTYSRDVRDISSANSLGDQKIWTSHGNVVDLKLQLQIQEFINSQKISRIRFTSFEKENTSSGVEYLFHGDDGRNYHRQANGNVYSADASKIPTLSQCRERAKEGIWKIEIKMKEVTMPELSKGNGLKK